MWGMDYQTNDFDYHLPTDRISQTPAVPRESAKLMVVNRKTGSISHRHIAGLPFTLEANDVLVINNTKVFHARLTSGATELFLIRPMANNTWQAIGKPGKKLIPGTNISFAPSFIATILEKHDDGTLIVTFNKPKDEVIMLANQFGEVPVPPYIKKIPSDTDYQTVYAKRVGSVAAPTAGFHLTKGILKQLTSKGVTILEITLHVGLGTFLPIKSESLNTHTMHSEWVSISADVAQNINDAKAKGQRIIAVGTTTVRTLEGVAALHNGKLEAYEGDVNLFIQPGFHFNIIDGLLTNFHLPKSTLIVLVSAFANRQLILKAYNEAVNQNYRFYSFGDAMLII